MAFLTIEITVVLMVIYKLLWNSEDHCQHCLDLICCAVDNSNELKNICLMNSTYMVFCLIRFATCLSSPELCQWIFKCGERSI